MPNGRIHHRIGRLAGGAYAAARAGRSTVGDPIAEGLAGLLVGGPVGASLPDIFEPACWNHRRVAHSLTAGSALVLTADWTEVWAENCRQRSFQHRQLAADTARPVPAQLWHSLLALFWSALAGCLNGILAGYVSHLALDALTPASIPIL